MAHIMSKNLAFITLLAICGPVLGDEVVVHNGDIQLKADFLLPEPSRCERCPLVVIAQGSGKSDRRNPWTKAWAEALLAQGVAVIHPDKRGSGASGGDWMAARIEDLAGDVSAFVDFAALQSRVDPRRIGVIGFSQGGDVVSVVAASDSKVKFVISVSGSVVPLSEQMLDEILIDADSKGLDPGQKQSIREIHSAVSSYAGTGKGFDRVERAVEQGMASHLPAAFLDNVPAQNDLKTWAWLRKVIAFDPLPYWRQATAPTAFIFGRHDRNVDTLKSIRIIHSDLMVKNAPVSVLAFNENGHALFRAEAVQFVAAFAQTAGNNE